MVNTRTAMLGMAETWELVAEGKNPWPHVARYKVGRRERFLMQAEFSRLGRVLSDAEARGEVSSDAATAIRLLMLTVCRRREFLRLRSDVVDLERRELRLSDGETGPRTGPLSRPAARVLADRPRVPGTPWVIPGSIAGRHLTTIDRPWSRIRARAALDDVCLNDLRHLFASRALALGESLRVIGKLLGHTEVQTTARYSYRAGDSVKESAARIGASIREDIFMGPGTGRHA